MLLLARYCHSHPAQLSSRYPCYLPLLAAQQPQRWCMLQWLYRPACILLAAVPGTTTAHHRAPPAPGLLRVPMGRHRTYVLRMVRPHTNCSLGGAAAALEGRSQRSMCAPQQQLASMLSSKGRLPRATWVHMSWHAAEVVLHLSTAGCGRGCTARALPAYMPYCLTATYDS